VFRPLGLHFAYGGDPGFDPEDGFLRASSMAP